MILDTCALLWLASGAGRLSPSALKRINEAPAVYVSSISGFEIALKVARGKLELPCAPKEWFKRVIQHHSLSLLPLDLEVCITAAELPPVHSDPCDRFIIATAKLHELTVVTADPRFGEYGIDVVQ